MKKKLLVLLLSSLATGVMAQSKNFEGPTAALSLSSIGASTKIDISGSDLVGVGGQTVVPSLELGYNYAVDNKILLGLSATYDFTKINSGEITSAYKLEGQNHFSINIKPSYAVTDSALIYAIIGYNRMKGSVTNLPESTNFTGIGYGVGALLNIDKNLYLQVEAQRVDFGSQTNTIGGTAVTYKPSASIAKIGVGYRF